MTTTNEILSKYRNLVAKSKSKANDSTPNNLVSIEKDSKINKKEINDIQESKNRQTVTNLLKKFEAKPIINTQEINENTQKFTTNDVEDSKKQSQNIFNKFIPTEDYFDYYDHKKGNSYRELIQNPKDSVNDNNQTDSRIIRKSASQRITGEENIQRKSVSELIKLNENRLREYNQRFSSTRLPKNKLKIYLEEHEKNKFRSTTVDSLNKNINEIKGLLKFLREEVKQNINKDELIRVNELIGYYEQKLQTSKCQPKKIKQERNTINSNNIKSVLNLRVSVIKEEEDENSRHNSDINGKVSNKESTDNLSIHYLSTVEGIEKTLTIDSSSNNEKKFDNFRCKTMIKDIIKIPKEKKPLLKDREADILQSLKKIPNNHHKNLVKSLLDEEKILFNEGKLSKLENENNNKETLIKREKEDIFVKDYNSEEVKKLEDKQNILSNKNNIIESSQNKLSYEHSSTNINSTCEAKGDKKFSINNVNNIVIFANYDQKKIDERKNTDSLKFESINKRSKTFLDEILIHKNKFKNNKQKEKKNKLITNKLKIFKYFIEENTDNIKNSFKEPSINYKKNIINSLDKICVSQYNLGKEFPLNNKFLDILCINCYECVKFNEVDIHSEICVVKPFHEYQFTNKTIDEDINSKIFKLYQNLKKRESEFLSTKEEGLINTYQELIDLVHNIFLNNNSTEEMDNSINKLNDMISTKLNNITSDYNFSLLIYAKRVTQLVFNKLNDIEHIIHQNEDENIYSGEDKESEDNDQFIILKNELKNLERDTIKSKMELIAWRKEAKTLEKLLQRPINNPEALSDIVSEVLSSREEEELDNLTNITGQTEQDIGNMNDVNEILNMKKKTDEDLRKYFISIVLNYKFKFVDKIEDNINVDEMYEKVKKIDLPINEWETFIKKELKIL